MGSYVKHSYPSFYSMNEIKRKLLTELGSLAVVFRPHEVSGVSRRGRCEWLAVSIHPGFHNWLVPGFEKHRCAQWTRNSTTP